MEEDLSSTEDAWPGPCCFWRFRTLRRDKHTSSAPRCDNNKAQMNLPTLSKELLCDCGQNLLPPMGLRSVCEYTPFTYTSKSGQMEEKQPPRIKPDTV